MPYQVFVAEDETFAREGIRNCLETTQDFVLCGEAEDGEMALPAILELKPDILITDIKMPFMDGLALARAVRRAMPWIRILIISGYDEFDFAKQAISIGVDEYLLKPFTSKILLDALSKLGTQIEAEREQALQADRHRLHEQREQQVLRDAFLESLLTGTPDTGKAMEQAARHRIDLPARKYVTATVELRHDAALSGVPGQIRDFIATILDADQDVLWCLRGSDRLALIIKGDTDNQLDERAYEIINRIQAGLKRQFGIAIVSAIGSVAERVGELAASFRHASNTLKSLPLPPGTVVNFSDMHSGVQGFAPLSAGMPAHQRLRHATQRDVEDIIADMREQFAESGINSVLYGYYWLMDILISAARMVNEMGGDIHLVFPELDDTGALLRAASSEEELANIARDALNRFIRFRETAGGYQYGAVIAQAKEYIYEHYGESALSLNTVAAVCGFSPNHFSSIFSLHMGETFIGFLTRVRIERAKELLLTTDMRTADVAHRVGYQDPNYFRFLFKKQTGASLRGLKNASDSEK